MFSAAADDRWFAAAADAVLHAAAHPQTSRQPAAHVLQAASKFKGVLQHTLSGLVSKSLICAPRLRRKIEGGTSKKVPDGDSAIYMYLVLQWPLKCVP